jgi:DNA-binding NarL/FixJ family response regulator
MNIVIYLSSRLLCEALQKLLEVGGASYRAMVVDNLDQCHDFTPDKILVDAATLEHSVPVQWNDAKIILIDTGLSEEQVVRLILTHHLDGVISTGTGTGLFLKALRVISSGQIWIDNSKLKAMFHSPLPVTKSVVPESFSRKEREIVLLIAEGRKNREIAEQLNISEQTVKTHISRILKKSDATSRAQLVPLALKFML